MNEKSSAYYLAAFQTTKKQKLMCNNGIELFQFADVHCKTTGEAGPLHQQWCHEITFVYSGQGEIIHNGIKLPIRSGQIHLCNKGTFHQVIPSSISLMRFFCIGFNLDEENPLNKMLNQVFEKIEKTQNPIINDCVDLITVFETALNSLYEKEKNEITDAVAINALNYIITSVSKRFLTSIDSTNNISLQESLLVYIISYLKNNIYKIDALKDLSEDTGYSYPYLSHLFSQKMGQSLKGFFTVLRMNTATELLRKKRVTEVAEILGYSSIHSFSRAYKKFCDETPCSAKDKLEDNDITKYI